MKKLLKLSMISTILCIGLFSLVGCGNSEKSKNNEEVSVLDNDKNYFISINGEKYYAGDKIEDFENEDLAIKSSEGKEELPANKYMIGAGSIQNEDGETIFRVTPYNTKNSKIKVSEAVIGGVTIGGLYADYDELKELGIKIEVYGGIKLGSTEEEVKKVFGEPESEYEGKNFKTATYDSKETYRKYEFKYDEDGKVTTIEWQNLVFNK